MSVFNNQGERLFWTIYGDDIIRIDTCVVTPVIERLGGRFHLKFPMGSNSFNLMLFCRLLEIVYDYQEHDTPLEVSVYDQYPKHLLGTFTLSDEWGEEEGRDRFEQFLRAIV